MRVGEPASAAQGQEQQRMRQGLGCLGDMTYAVVQTLHPSCPQSHLEASLSFIKSLQVARSIYVENISL